MSRKICVVTGTRAEFGLMRWLMQEVQTTPGLALQVLATGMHLSPEFGLTYKEIEQAGFAIDARVEMLLSSDTSTAVTKSMGLGMIGYADEFARLSPYLIVVLGNRFEIFAAAGYESPTVTCFSNNLNIDISGMNKFLRERDCYSATKSA